MNARALLRPAALLSATVLLLAALAGCVAPETEGDFGDTSTGAGSGGAGSGSSGSGGGTSVSNWKSQRDAHGPMGVSATFDLSGAPFYLTGDGTVSQIPAPFDLEVGGVFPSNKPFLYFQDATVKGKGTGLLVLEGRHVHASAGALADLHFKHTTVDANIAIYPKSETTPTKPSGTFPSDWEDANRSAFFSDGIVASAQALALSGYDRAVLIAGSQATTLTGTIEATAASFFWDDDDSFLRVQKADFDLDTFGVAGHPDSGALDAEGYPKVTTPAGLFGHNAKIRAESKHVASIGSFRLTQALKGDGKFLLAADLEMKPSRREVSVANGSTEWVKVDVRERGYVGDAVTKNVTITGSGASLVKVPVERPPLLVQALWDLVGSAGWATPFLAIPLVLVTPGLLMIDFILAIFCAFSTCPEKYPFPLWLDAGAVDVFYFKVTGDLAPGTYEATIAFEGHNYPTVTVPVTVRVTAAST